jgi:hypothetical protein
MQDGEYVVNHNHGLVSNSWHVRGTGDFDGDGDADILWHHDGGQIVSWEMEDGAYVVNRHLEDIAPILQWQFMGTGDLDQDGDADILLHHPLGYVGTVLLEDWAISGSEIHGPVPTAWQIRGTGEFEVL